MSKQPTTAKKPRTPKLTPERAIHLLTTRAEQYEHNAVEYPNSARGYRELAQAARMGAAALEAEVKANTCSCGVKTPHQLEADCAAV